MPVVSLFLKFSGLYTFRDFVPNSVLQNISDQTAVILKVHGIYFEDFKKVLLLNYK